MQELTKERDHHMMLANQYKQDCENLQNEFNDYKNIQHLAHKKHSEEMQAQAEQFRF